MTSNGYSPLTVIGLDSRIMYSVTINVFDGNQVVLRDQTVMRTITVLSDQSGKFMYIVTYVHACSYTQQMKTYKHFEYCYFWLQVL